MRVCYDTKEDAAQLRFDSAPLRGMSPSENECN